MDGDSTANGTATQTNGTATTTGGVAAEVTPNWAKELNENIGKMVQGVNEIRELNARGLAAQTAVADEPEPEVDDPLADPNLDLLPMSQVARRILGQVEGVVQRALKPVIEKVGQTEVTAKTAQITEEVNDFARRTPDFGVWGDEMQAVAKQYPEMRIEDIYSLAKTRNPVKVEKLSGERKTTEEKAAAAAAKKKPIMALSAGGQTGEIVNERMSPGDAAKSAWQETVEKFGGSPFA